jgi:hypothetical protein
MTGKKLSFCCLSAAMLITFSVTAQVTTYGTEAGTGGNRNTNIGYRAGKVSTGLSNILVGHAAGQNNTTGAANSFVGAFTGLNNTTGYNNAFFGGLAGYNNNEGIANSFMGFEAGYSNTTGDLNSFFGYQAGYGNTTEGGNSFFGAQAGHKNKGGSNSFFGSSVGIENVSGYGNSFFGSSAGRSNSTGHYNVFFGYISGYRNTTGQSNSFYGSFSGSENTTGQGNTFVGYQSGQKNSTGGSNTSLGIRAGYSLASGYSNTFVGANAGQYTTGSLNTFFGSGAGSDVTTGFSNLYLGKDAGARNTSGYDNVFVGPYAGANSTGNNNVFIGANAGNQETGSNRFIVGNNNNTFLYGDIESKKLGIGTTDLKDFRLSVNGSDISHSSWLNERTFFINIPMVDALGKIKQLTGEGRVIYPTNEIEYKVNAHTLRQILPDLVKSDLSAVNYQGLIPVLVEAIKELSNKVSVLETKLAEFTGGFSPASTANGSSLKSALHQNMPNPANEATVINYSIGNEGRQASIYLFDAQGNEVKAFHQLKAGEGEVSMATVQLRPGLYHYSLVVNGNVVDTKSMIVSKN